jgi:hypothetical protein
VTPFLINGIDINSTTCINSSSTTCQLY